MKKIFFLLIVLFSFTTYAQNKGFYTGLNYGNAADDGSGAEKLSGPIYGVNLGYRWYHWALEAGYSKFDLKSEGGQTDLVYIDKAELNGQSFDFMLRAFFLRFLNIGLGYSMASADHDFRFKNINNVPGQNKDVKGSSDYTGTILQLGLVLPLFRWLDLQVLYEMRNLMNDDAEVDVLEPLGGGFKKISGQLVFYFN